MEINQLTGIVLDACIKIHWGILAWLFRESYEETPLLRIE